MKTFSPGSVVELSAMIGDAWSPARLFEVVILTQFSEPFNHEHPEIRVAPISRALKYATNFDVICAASDSELGEEFLVEVWNQRAMLVEHLGEKRGDLSPKALRAVYAVHNALVGEARANDDLSDALVGSPIEQDSDPRIQYQEHRHGLAEELSRKAEAILFKSTVVVAVQFSSFYPLNYAMRIPCVNVAASGYSFGESLHEVEGAASIKPSDILSAAA